MSYTIEYSRKVFYKPKGTTVPAGFGKIEHQTWEDEYYIFVKSGCNNISPRPKDWHLRSHGWNYSVICQVCQDAGYTEGGGIKFTSGDTTPENYLRIYRQEIAKAEIITAEGLKTEIGLRGFRIFLGNDTPRKDYVSSMIDEMKQYFTYKGKFCDNYDEYARPFETLEDFDIFLQFSWLGKETGGFQDLSSSDNN